jgi:hypothetical protein
MPCSVCLHEIFLIFCKNFYILASLRGLNSNDEDKVFFFV